MSWWLQMARLEVVSGSEECMGDLWADEGTTQGNRTR